MLAGHGAQAALGAAQRRPLPRPARPNLVMGANVQVCWEKFCNFWEVEAAAGAHGGRPVPPGPAEAAAELCDENTIGVVGDPRLHLRRLLRAGRGAVRGAGRPAGADRAGRPGARRRRVRRDGRAVPRRGPGVGLPAAAGGLDQHLGAQVRAGLPGRRLGAVARRGGAAGGAGLPGQLPGRRHADLRAELLPARARRSSRSTTPSCGWAARATGPCSRPPRDVATGSPARIEALGDFRLLTRGDELPVFAFTTAPDVHGVRRLRRLRGGCASSGWLVPAYTFPANREDLPVLRMVGRNGLWHDLAALLLDELRQAVRTSARSQIGRPCPRRRSESASFSQGPELTGSPLGPTAQRL